MPAESSPTTKPRSPSISVVYLTLAGLVSSLLTLRVGGLATKFLGMFGIGVIFGVVLATCFCLGFGVRSPWKLGGFVVTSAAAFPLAVFSVGSIPFGYFRSYFYDLFASGHFPQGHIDPISLFGPGALGAFLVLAAGLFAIASQKQSSRRILLKSLLWSLVGGVLGATGYALGPSLGLVLWKAFRALTAPISAAQYQAALTAGEPNFYSMYLMWQTGVALLLGLLWWHGEAAVAVAGPAASPEAASVASKRIPLAAKLFFIGAAVLFLYFAGRDAWISYTTARTRREIAQSLAEAPPTENLPPVQPMNRSQALILSPIRGYVVLDSTESHFSAARSAPPASAAGVSRAYYYANYVKAAKGGVTIAGRPEISVSLSQFPSPAWARYQLRNTPTPNAAYRYARYRKKVMKFGNWVLQVASQQLLFIWPSGDNLVSVRFRQSEQDEFLKAYLQKYPSDLRP